MMYMDESSSLTQEDFDNLMEVLINQDLGPNINSFKPISPCTRKRIEWDP